jgi:hypothetical protein
VLTEATKANVRRHLQFPAIGLLRVSAGGQTLGSAAAGYRFFEVFGQLEWRLNNLAGNEEAMLTGASYGSVILVGPQPAQGDTVSITVSGGLIPSPVTVTATAPAPSVDASGQPTDTRINLVNGLAAGIAANAVLQSLGVYSAAPYGTGPYSQNAAAVPEISIVSPFDFAISATGSGVLKPQVTANGVKLPPSASLDGGTTTLYGYLGILDGLESAFAGSSDNLDTKRAAVWEHHSQELAMRQSLYQSWVSRLSDFLNIPVNPRRTGTPATHLGVMRFS